MVNESNNYSINLRDETKEIFEYAYQYYTYRHRINDISDGVEFGHIMLVAEYRAGLKCIDKHIKDNKFVSTESRNLIVNSVDDFRQTVAESYPLLASVAESYLTAVKYKS